jgi:lipopolysaccharide biosynthesis glycosyltransferase
MMAEVIPRTVRRVLYLDADIIVCDDIAPLQEKDLNGAAVGAVLDCLDMKIKTGVRLWTSELPSVTNYLNAGVLLIDLEKWREDRIPEKAMDYLRKYPQSPLSDQDALNVACDGKWEQLNARWNVIDDLTTEILGTNIREGPAIVHFAGPLKPWQVGVLHPNARFYDRIRSRTCFAKTTAEKLRDYLGAPRQFYRSGLLYQLRRALRRSVTLRRLWLRIKYS